MPKVQLSVIDILLIMIDMYYLYKLKQGRICNISRPFFYRFLRGAYMLRRALFYFGLAVNVVTSFFDVTVVDAPSE